MYSCLKTVVARLAVVSGVLLLGEPHTYAAIPQVSSAGTSITSISPKELQKTTVQILQLTINNLPPLTGPFFCLFTIFDKEFITNATRNDLGVSCLTPDKDLLPSLSQGQHHYTARLSVKTSGNSELVHTNVTFFDCNTYISCMSCISSNVSCNWCVATHQCTHDSVKNCPYDIVVDGINSGGPSYRKGPTFCPSFNSTADGSREILIADGTKKSLRIRTNNFNFIFLRMDLHCQFNIEGNITTVQAELIGDILYCGPMEFTYSQQRPYVAATFSVMWNSSFLDNPDDIHVLIYKCPSMADDCGMCLALDQKFGCGWCQSTDRCEIQDQCQYGHGAWRTPKDSCPIPSILSFHPQLGPWEGGTNITIQGTGLGTSFADIYSGIAVAGLSCEPYQHLYRASREIVCRVDGPGTSQYRHGPILVKVGNFRSQSKKEYEFVDPQIEDILPKRGPKSGGTVLSIKGKYMNAGSSIEVYIDDLPCHIIGIVASEIQCRTSTSNRQREGKIKVKFDQGIRMYDKDLYEYA